MTVRKLTSAICALVLAGAALLAGSPAVAEAKSFSVSAKASAGKAVTGDKIKVSGTVKGKSSKRTVYLQMRLDGSKKWSQVAKSKASKSGAYTFTTTVTSATDRYYRVYKPKEGKYKADYSGKVRVVVDPRVTTRTTAIAYDQQTVTDPTRSACAPAVVTTAGQQGARVDYYQDGRYWKTTTTAPVTQVTTVGTSPAPCVTAITPSKATAGSSITLTGKNLAGATVAFGSTTAGVTSTADTQLVVTAPDHAGGSATVAVTTSAGTTTAGQFTYLVPPKITAVTSAGSIDGGQTITVTGQGFTTTTGVTFTPVVAARYTSSGDGTMPAVDATFKVISDDRVDVVVPPATSLSAVLRLTADAGADSATVAYSTSGRQPSAAEQGFLDQVNVYRAGGGTCDGSFSFPSEGPLTWDPLLAELAMSHTADILYRPQVYRSLYGETLISHLTPGISTMGNRWPPLGFPGGYSEVITAELPSWGSPSQMPALQTPTASDGRAAAERFYYSPGHCKVLMNAAASKIGVGLNDGVVGSAEQAMITNAVVS